MTDNRPCDYYADLVLRVAQSAAARAVVDAAPVPTGGQLAAVRAACAPAVTRFRIPEAVDACAS